MVYLPAKAVKILLSMANNVKMFGKTRFSDGPAQNLSAYETFGSMDAFPPGEIISANLVRSLDGG